MKKYLWMAKLNYKNYKRLTHNSITNMVVSSILFLVMVSFGISSTKLFANYNYQNVNLREILIATSPDHITDEQLMNMRLIPSVEELYVGYPLISSTQMTIQIGSQYIHSYRIDGSHVNHATFAPRFVMDRNDGTNINPIVYGRSFNGLDKNAVIIDENMTYILGYEHPEDMIGQIINIQVADVELSHLIIVGIYHWSLGGFPRSLHSLNDFERLSYINQTHTQPIIVSHDVVEHFWDSSSEIRTDLRGKRNIVVFADSADHVALISEKLSNITNNWVYSDVAAIEQRTKAINDMSLLVLVISISILVVSLVSIANVLMIKIDAQKKLTQMMRNMGYSKKDIFAIYIVDSMIVFYKAMVISIGISFLLTLFIDMIFVDSYRQMSTINRFLFIIDPILILLYLFSLAFVIVMITYLILKTQMKSEDML